MVKTLEKVLWVSWFTVWGVSTQKKEKPQIEVVNIFPSVGLTHYYLQWTVAMLKLPMMSFGHFPIHFYALVGQPFQKLLYAAIYYSTWLKKVSSRLTTCPYGWSNYIPLVSLIMCQAFSMLNSRVSSQVRRSDCSVLRKEEDLCTGNVIYHLYKVCNFLPLHSQGQVTDECNIWQDTAHLDL